MATSAKKKAAERARAEAQTVDSAPAPTLPQCNCLALIRRRSQHAIGCPLMGIDD